MPYYVNVGIFANNLGKIGARGWHIWRRGRWVHWEYGSIEIERTRPKRIRWVSCHRDRKPLSSVEAAKDFMRRRTKNKVRDNRKGYAAYVELVGKKILPKLKRRRA